MSVIEETEEENLKPTKKKNTKYNGTLITQKYGIGTQKPNETPTQKPKEEIEIPIVAVGDNVLHKNWGEGTIFFMDKAQKRIKVKFNKGEKTFVFPDAFLQGHLKIK